MSAPEAHAHATSNGIVDANMHWLPPTLFTDEALLGAFIEAAPRAYGIHARVAPIPGKSFRQIIIDQPEGHEALNYAENQYSGESQVADLDAAGIAQGILRMPCWQEWLDLDLCRRMNDMLAAHVARWPGRLHALAIVPPWGAPAMLREAERCVQELGFKGVQLAAHYGNLYLDDAAFRPYFELLNTLGVPVVVHHTPLPVDYGSIVPYDNLRRQYGRCIAQATAVGRELFSGMFEQFPDLKLVHSMLGGGFFAFADMLVPASTGRDEVDRFGDQRTAIQRYLANNIYYDLSGAPQWGTAQLECAVKVFGADHILYGGSYPIRRDWFEGGADYVRSLAISEEDKGLILGGNARRLFRL